MHKNHLLLCLASSLLLSACGGSSDQQATKQETDDTASQVNTGPGGLPMSTERALRPVEGSSLDLAEVQVTDEGGNLQLLTGLLDDRTLLVFLDLDIDERRPRAATRALRRVTRGAAELGFRVVMIAPRSATASEVTDFRRSRNISLPVFRDTTGTFQSGTNWAPGTAALLGPQAVVMEQFAPAEGWDERFGYMPPLNDEVIARAWAPPGEVPTIPSAERGAAVDYVRALLAAGGEGSPTASGMDTPVPDGLYLSLWREGVVEGLRGEGQGANLGAALNSAVGQIIEGLGAAASPWVAASANVRVVIDVAGPSTPVLGKELRTLWYEVEPGIDGLIVEQDGKRGVIVPADPVTYGWLTPRNRGRDQKITDTLTELHRRAGLPPQAWLSGATLERFRSLSFGSLSQGSPILEWVRGNDLRPEMDEAALLGSIDEGGRWLLRTVQPDGKFDYEFFPNTNSGSEDYNVVRHAGSAYGLFEMWEFARNEPTLRSSANDYLEAGSRAVRWVYDALEVPENAKGEGRQCLIARNKCESGAAALALLTYISLPEASEISDPRIRRAINRPENAAEMEGLALTLVDMIDSDGRMFRKYREATSLDSVQREPLYYPGESMLALLRYYQHTNDRRWLEAAELIADRRIRDYRADRWENPDHWVMQGFDLLHEITGKAKYAETLEKMSIFYASQQYRPGLHLVTFPDYQGAYRRTNDQARTTRAGSRSEALAGAVRTSWRLERDATIAETALVEAARHLWEQQFRPENSFYMAGPQRARGAYPMGLVDNHCRIDNNQHALVCMVAALGVMRKYGPSARVTPAGFVTD